MKLRRNVRENTLHDVAPFTGARIETMLCRA